MSAMKSALMEAEEIVASLHARKMPEEKVRSEAVCVFRMHNSNSPVAEAAEYFVDAALSAGVRDEDH